MIWHQLQSALTNGPVLELTEGRLLPDGSCCHSSSGKSLLTEWRRPLDLVVVTTQASVSISHPGPAGAPAASLGGPARTLYRCNNIYSEISLPGHSLPQALLTRRNLRPESAWRSFGPCFGSQDATPPADAQGIQGRRTDVGLETIYSVVSNPGGATGSAGEVLGISGSLAPTPGA